MYERFFNLTAEPFRLSPDHRFSYKYPHYARVKAYMAYALRRAEGFVVLTGPAGSGKTTLINDVVEYLAQERVVVATLVSTQLVAEDLLRMVAFTFGVDAQGLDKPTILQRLNARFLAIHSEGTRALLIVDEAQDLTPKSLEQLRLLTNLEQGGGPLLQIFLLGQPQLRELLRDKRLEPVSQRIIAASQLIPLTEEETRNYVVYRLRVVGWKNDPVISESVFHIIYQYSEGVPQRINLICNHLLLHCFVKQSHQVSITDALEVVEKVLEEQLPSRNLPNDNVVFAEDLFEKRLSDEPLPEERVQEKQVLAEPISKGPLPEEGVPAAPLQSGPFLLLDQPEMPDLQCDKRRESSEVGSFLTVAETQAYVEDGLRAVGWSNHPVIEVPVFRIVHQFSEGVPGRINLVCNRMLLKSFLQQRDRITIVDARAAVNELPEDPVATHNPINEAAPESLRMGEPFVVKKAQFQSRDVAFASHDQRDNHSKSYIGPERRRANRRSAVDRCKGIRFEAGGGERRKNLGRRYGDKNVRSR